MPARRTRKPDTKTTSERIELPKLVGDVSAPHFNPHQIRVINTFLDFVLLLGQMKIAPDGQPALHAVATIGLSPEHLKALSKLLARKIEEYEKEFGPIPEAP